MLWFRNDKVNIVKPIFTYVAYDIYKVSCVVRKEMRDGAESLKEKIVKYQPRIAVFNGKGAYHYVMGNIRCLALTPSEKERILIEVF